LVENFRYAPDPFEQFIYSTQLIQAECLASAYPINLRMKEQSSANTDVDAGGSRGQSRCIHDIRLWLTF
jgi:hypothetical protein